MTALWTEIHWQNVVSVLAALFIYAFLLVPLGFILSTILLLVFLFKAFEPQKWPGAIIGAVITTLAAYGLFQVWLR